MALGSININLSSRGGSFILNLPIGELDSETPITSVKLGVTPKEIKNIIGKSFVVCGQNIDEELRFEYVLPSIQQFMGAIGIGCSFNNLFTSPATIIIAQESTENDDSWTIMKQN